ncbi:putative protein CXorf58 [Allomyces arbusculus]|nr:putative protein CXorf58 [Allomyces arbusculus]
MATSFLAATMPAHAVAQSSHSLATTASTARAAGVPIPDTSSTFGSADTDSPSTAQGRDSPDVKHLIRLSIRTARSALSPEHRTRRSTLGSVPSSAAPTRGHPHALATDRGSSAGSASGGWRAALGAEGAAHGFFYADDRVQACRTIWRAWVSFRNRRIFQRLTNLLLRSETSLTLHLLKRLSPMEAQLLRDPVSHARIRFRFGGPTFPPDVMYKVSTRGVAVHYLSGQQALAPDTQAARDAWTLMGNPRYQATAVADDLAIHYHRSPQSLVISDPMQITSRRDHVRYLAGLDTRAPELGGRANGWRRLDGVHSWAEAVGRVRGRGRGRVRKPRPMGDAPRAVEEDTAVVARVRPMSQGAKVVSRADREKQRRIKQIERLRALYMADGARVVRDAHTQPVATRSVSAALPGAEFEDDDDEEGAEGDGVGEGAFDTLFAWSNTLDIDDYNF